MVLDLVRDPVVDLSRQLLGIVRVSLALDAWHSVRTDCVSYPGVVCMLDAFGDIHDSNIVLFDPIRTDVQRGIRACADLCNPRQIEGLLQSNLSKHCEFIECSTSSVVVGSCRQGIRELKKCAQSIVSPRWPNAEYMSLRCKLKHRWHP